MEYFQARHDKSLAIFRIGKQSKFVLLTQVFYSRGSPDQHMPLMDRHSALHRWNIEARDLQLRLIDE